MTAELGRQKTVADRLTAMPKADLHCHLDGALRIETIADLVRQEEISVPVPSDRLAEICVAPPRCRDLMDLLSYFDLAIRVLQNASALERVTYELCQDVATENVRYLEIRYAPVLHRNRGLSLDEIIRAVLHGWEAGSREFGLTGGVILCGIRQMPPESTLATARAGVPYLGKGVVGFDLAGDEAGYPVLLHREPLLWARNAGYEMTIHAGEAAGAKSVRDAVEIIGASRIGHGTHSGEDPSLLPELRRRRITLEMCPTSNAQSQSVADMHRHPLLHLYREGVQVTVNTDNRTVSQTTETNEMALVQEKLGVSVEELAAMSLTAVEAGFAEESERRALLREMRQSYAALGIEPAVQPGVSA